MVGDCEPVCALATERPNPVRATIANGIRSRVEDVPIGFRPIIPSASYPKKKKGPAQWPVPPKARLAFGNDRRRRGLALAVVRAGLCGGRDAKESHSHCRQ